MKGLSYGQIAAKIGSTEQHVVDSTYMILPPVDLMTILLTNTPVCTGNAAPTKAEYAALAEALGITASVCLQNFVFICLSKLKFAASERTFCCLMHSGWMRDCRMVYLFVKHNLRIFCILSV